MLEKLFQTQAKKEIALPIEATNGCWLKKSSVS